MGGEEGGKEGGKEEGVWEKGERGKREENIPQETMQTIKKLKSLARQNISRPRPLLGSFLPLRTPCIAAGMVTIF